MATTRAKLFDTGREIATVAPADSRDAETDEVVVPWRGRPWSIGPVAHVLRFSWRGRRVQWLDDAGELGPCGLGFLFREGARLMLLRGCDLLLSGVARLLVARSAPQRIAGQGSNSFLRGAVIFAIATSKGTCALRRRRSTPQ